MFGDRFLAQGVEAPSSLAGERWGAESLSLTLPGGSLRLEGLNVRQREVMTRRWTAFLAPAEEATDVIAVCRVASSSFAPFDVRGWEYQVALEHTRSHVRVVGLGMCAVLERASGPGCTVFTSSDGEGDFDGQLENAVRIFVAYRLLARGGLLLHAAAVGHEGRASVFVGRSGAGKSTWARKCAARRLPVLGDDLVGLVREGPSVLVVPLPFSGDFPATHVRPMPLHRLWALEPGPQDACLEASVASMVACVTRCAPWVNRDALLGDDVLSAAAWVVGSVPTGRLASTLGGPVDFAFRAAR